METDEFFTIKEKDLLFSLYRKLLQLSGETLQKGDCKKLKTHLVNTIQNNRIQRDIFGLNPVIKDMQTAVIVAEEIGMKRASILGLMLHDSVRCGTCTALEVEQIYGEDVAGIIRGLIRVNELYSNEDLFAEIRKHIACDAKARSFRLNSSRIDEKHPFVQKAVKMGRVPFGSPTLSDQALMSFASVKIGPGRSSRSHTAEEYIMLKEIEEAIGIYLDLLDGLKL